MVTCELTKSELRVFVHSRIKPKSSITFTCSPGDATTAVFGAAQAAATCNIRFGDNLDPKHAVACIKQFMNNCPHMKCRTCGWRNQKNSKCNLHGHTYSEGGTCPQYKHVFVVKDDCNANGSLIG